MPRMGAKPMVRSGTAIFTLASFIVVMIRCRRVRRARAAPLSSPFDFQPVALALGETDRKKSTARRSRVESEAPLADELQALLGASRGLAEGLAGGGAAPVS